MSNLWEPGVEEGGGLRAMMVLLLKQMHLQKVVAVELALRIGWESVRRMRRVERREEEMRFMAVYRLARASLVVVQGGLSMSILELTT